jgi:general secretion pathway protein B
MSYILDALKKADQERIAGSVPDLETMHRHEPATRKSSRWLWILAVLFLFNAVAVTLFAIRYNPGAGKETVVGRTAPDERGSALPNTPHLRPSAPTAGAGTVIRKAPPTVPGTASQPREQGRVAMAGRQASSPPIPPSISAAAASSPPSQGMAPAHSPAPATARIPEWDELPVDFRSGFTMPRIDVHVYDTNPQNRFILADMRKYHEGDRLQNGVILEKILPDGLQLSYQGRTFHYNK